METTNAADVTSITDEQVENFFETGEIEKAPEEVTEVKEEPKEEKKVNYGALHEERERRKALQKEVESYKSRTEKMERAFQEIVQRNRPEPTYEEDPVEALRLENQQIKQFLNAQAQQSIAQVNDSQYWTKFQESENAFKQDAPDYDVAVKFLTNTRLEELKDLGFSDAEAKKVIGDEIRWIADKAYNDEVNPAERFYNLAKRRGYKQEVSPVETKLKTIQKGMQVNRSLPNGSKSTSNDLTLEALSAMDGEEFDQAWEKLMSNGR